MHSLLLGAYLWAIRHDVCPCCLARYVDQGLVAVFGAISRATAYIGGSICRRLDRMISAADGVCTEGCAGCSKVPA